MNERQHLASTAHAIAAAASQFRQASYDFAYGSREWDLEMPLLADLSSTMGALAVGVGALADGAREVAGDLKPVATGLAETLQRAAEHLERTNEELCTLLPSEEHE